VVKCGGPQDLKYPVFPRARVVRPLGWLILGCKFSIGSCGAAHVGAGAGEQVAERVQAGAAVEGRGCFLCGARRAGGRGRRASWGEGADRRTVWGEEGGQCGVRCARAHILSSR